MGQTTAAGPGSGGKAGPAGPDSAESDSAETEKDRVVELLGGEWSIIIGLLAGLDDAAWSRPALPGWDVHDVLAHLIGTERTLAGEQHPDPADIDAGRHVRNAIGKANEAWVLALRDRPHARTATVVRRPEAGDRTAPLSYCWDRSGA